MKRLGLCLAFTLTIFTLLALAVSISMASQEQAKEAVQTATKTEGELSQKAKKTIGPVDSSTVIPKGPQWLGAPIMPDGTKIKEEPGRLITEYNLPYDKVLTWYKEALQKYPDARYRDWEEEMYIEDQGVSKWHSIAIHKTGGPKTQVVIKKDNWSWIMATLFIRFTGVFVVLLVLWVALNIAIFIMRKSIKEKKTKPAPA
ncbi:MAG: hypothetical protein FJ130_13635 [Deltaproteobacteria bacterium]|nr:hypothetical protein [Deltaproteobacteria bacterium]